MEPMTIDAGSGVSASHRLAWLLTLGYLGIAISAMFHADWPKALNEWGDFLAGVFAPLAFGWLVYGYYLQREELVLQRRELKATADANRDQATHLAAQVELLARQMDIASRGLRLAQAGPQPRLKMQVVSWELGSVRLRLINLGAPAVGVRLRSWENGWHPAPPWGSEPFELDLDEAREISFIPPAAAQTEFMVSVQCDLESGGALETTFYPRHDYYVTVAGTKRVTQ
jgi:hypothetical protein